MKSPPVFLDLGLQGPAEGVGLLGFMVATDTSHHCGSKNAELRHLGPAGTLASCMCDFACGICIFNCKGHRSISSAQLLGPVAQVAEVLPL